MGQELDRRALTGELSAKHRSEVPVGMIAPAVGAAATGANSRDPLDAERLVRADVAERADAARRRGAH
jgi:hypothetical protein